METQSEKPVEPSVVQERLNWRIAYRDDQRVAQALYEGQEREEIQELSEAGLLDEFFAFLEEVGMMRLFEGMQLPQVKPRSDSNGAVCAAVPAAAVLFGHESMNELPGVLFSNLALMELVGESTPASGRRADQTRRSQSQEAQEAGTPFSAVFG